MNSKTVTLNVCDDIRNGREPFSKIMATTAALRPDEQLLLIAPFEPVPLFRVLEKKGFRHTAQPNAAGDWEVLFTRQTEDQLSEAAPRPASPDRASRDPAEPMAAGPALSLEVDARGLEPPQPLIKILESVAALPPNHELRARTDRRPIHLYAQLEERGFTGRTEEQSDGSFITHIRHR